MRGADEVAEQAVMVEVAREQGDAPAAEDVAAFPIGARLGVDLIAQEAAVGGEICFFVGRAEEAVEGVVGRQQARRGELQLRQRHVRAVQVDGDDLLRVGGQVGEHVAAARGDGDHARMRLQRQRPHVDVRVFPDLRVDEPAEGEGEDALQDAFGRSGLCPMDGLVEAVGRTARR